MRLGTLVGNDLICHEILSCLYCNEFSDEGWLGTRFELKTINPSCLSLLKSSYSRCSLSLRSETIVARANVRPHGRQRLRSCLDLKPISQCSYLNLVICLIIHSSTDMTSFSGRLLSRSSMLRITFAALTFQSFSYYGHFVLRDDSVRLFRKINRSTILLDPRARNSA